AIKYYCYNGVCETNEAGINALVAYIFNQFKRSIENHEYNKYDEYFVMWLSDKLFKIHDESKDKDNEITLNQAYDTYLKNHKVNFNYWNFFYNIESLKESNLWYMSEFYKLLDKICKTITDYEKNREEITNLIRNSTECSNQYISIYNEIPKCQSYLDLLNKLKGIYDDFRNYAIRENGSNNNSAAKLQTLTTPDEVEMDAVRSFISYNFSIQQCKGEKKKKPDKSKQAASSQKAEPPGPQASSQASGSENQGNMNVNTERVQENGSDTSKGTDAETGDPGSISDGGQDSKVGDSGSGTEGTSGDTRSPNSENEKKSVEAKEPGDPSDGKDSQVNEGDGRNGESVDTDIGKGGSEGISGGEKDDPSSLQKDSHQTPSDTSQNSQSSELPSSTEENKTDQPSQDSSEKGSSDQTNQGEHEKPVDGSVIISENPGSDTKGNGTIGIGDIYIFKEFKKIGIPIIIILIAISLAIMCKFLVFDRRKKLKRKKK
ncbi:Plasmodium variant antigen protein Cir/Yir/Bir, putative, partial [Plasmodium chabaudi adami]